MAPTPHRTAQTTSEAKKQHKKNGPRLPERQQKQLERALELDQRAARLREAEDRRKAAKKKREERERKEERARQQMGVGLATQLIGYSHTQAQLKSGMEAFLGVKKRREEAQRKEAELTEKLEAIAENMEKEPWDEDDDADDIALDLPEMNTSSGEQWVDDDLDDDSLLEAHHLAISDPADESVENTPASPALAPPFNPNSTKHALSKEDPNFLRVHGPINKAIEAALDKLPEPLIELLSQDISTSLPDWDPQPGLLYKLNPVGLPPHRLRIKIGCVVTLLKDLNTSSQLSKSQHLQILRAENERLECLVLDGQLEGTRTFLTRLAFDARYKNQAQYPFRRIQFPIRIATNHTPRSLPRDVSQSGFKLPSLPGQVRPSSLPKKPSLTFAKAEPQPNQKSYFKSPGLPASKSSSSIPPESIPTHKAMPSIPPPPTDYWDDFLESGTQIARELAIEGNPRTASLVKAPVAASPSIADCLPPLSTQDFDFSLEDLDQETLPEPENSSIEYAVRHLAKPKPTTNSGESRSKAARLVGKTTSSRSKTTLATPPTTTKLAINAKQPNSIAATSNTSMPPPPRKPPSVSDRPGLKRKAWTAPQHSSVLPPKRPRVPPSRPQPSIKSATAFKTDGSSIDFMMSTQDVASFFDDDENLSFGSPPIPA